jgi:hypothetical protein
MTDARARPMRLALPILPVPLAAAGILQPDVPWGPAAAVWGWACALGYAASQIGIGLALLRGRLAPERLGACGALAIAAVVGFFVTHVVAGALASLRVLDAAGGGLCVLAALAGVLGARRWCPAPLAPALAPRARGWVAAGVVVFLAPYLLQTLLPDSDWDGAMYHLPMATGFLDRGLWTLDYPLSAQYRPGAVHLAYALLFSVGAEAALIPLNFLAVLGALAATYALARAIGGGTAALFAAATFLSTNLLLELGLDVRVDALLTLCVAAGGLAVVAAHDAQRGSAAAVAAIAASLALGTKYNGAFFAVLLLGAAAVLVVRTRPRRSATLAGLALLMLPGGFWYVRNAALFGDPMYPFLRGQPHRDAEGRFVHRDLDALVPDSAAPGPGAVAEVQRLREKDGGNTVRKKAVAGPLLLFDAMWNRDKYTTKPYHWVSPFLIAFFALPLVARGPPALWLLALGVAGYLLVFLNTHELRYAGPLLPLLAAGAGVVLARPPRAVRIALAAALVALGAWNSAAEWRKTAALEPQRYLGGTEDRLQYLSRVGYNGEPAMPQFVAWFNEQIAQQRIAPTEGVFMIGEAKGHMLQSPYLPGIGSAGSEWLVELINAEWDYDRLAASLRARGLRWILLNKGWMEWVMRNRLARPRRLALTLHHLRAFLDEHGTAGSRPLIEFGPLMLFRIRD